jgi:hypothetical protein
LVVSQDAQALIGPSRNIGAQRNIAGIMDIAALDRDEARLVEADSVRATAHLEVLEHEITRARDVDRVLTRVARDVRGLARLTANDDGRSLRAAYGDR